jgi:cellulose synthase/poly-beta-1,6-N-acetylglucosamine synthase-like glycosyltransferase/peptidoglycan/xylan/chitin deacetylase (PgdA/CDA1 family)/spore germination protein YaaH
MAEPTQSHPVFYDPKGRRWRRVRRTWIAFAVFVTVVLTIFILSVLANPILPALNLRPSPKLPTPADVKPLPTPPPVPKTAREIEVQRTEKELASKLATTRVVPASRELQKPPRLPSEISQAEKARPRPTPTQTPTPVVASVSKAKPLAIGFYVNWDDSSYSSLRRNLNNLDWVVPEWVRLQDPNEMQDNNPLVVDFGEQRPALQYIRDTRPAMPILPLVQNYKNEQWNPQILAHWVSDETTRAQLINALLDFVTKNKFAGVCIDFEEAPTQSQPNLLRFMQELYTAFHAKGLIVTQAVPFDDSDWDYPAYAAANDYLMLMAYDEHWSSSNAGPVAGQDWYETTLAKRLKELDPSKTIVAIGNYGYNWQAGDTEADEVTFQEAMLSAQESADDKKIDALIHFDPVSRNPYFKYEEDDGSQHTVWFLDAVTAYNQMRVASKSNFAGYALWRLGSEDPSLWQIFGADKLTKLNEPVSAGALAQIAYGYDVDFEGTGEILDPVAEPQTGKRIYAVDAQSGLISSQQYINAPSSYIIRRTGDRPGLIALTFDDGPDPVFTPKILDILKRENVPATFFIIGANGQAYPDLVKRIVNEGHDIGNHSFTHPNMGEIPGRVVELELTATQRLIESLTGRSTHLFRPPYFGDAEPQTPEEVNPIVRAKGLGYITIGLHIDPDDWERPGVDEIVQRTIKGATETDPDARGEIVLLHDAGGDRQQTVDALPKIIDALRAKNYKFVTVSQLAGLTRDQAMPPVPKDRSWYARIDALTFYSLSTIGWLLHWIFLIGIILGIARVLFIGALAFAQWLRARRREQMHAGEDYNPFVTIIIPAYNEEKVIARTIQSLLASDYKNFEILVVDDGSPDRTAQVVRENFAGDARVRLFVKENGGKAEALNFGLRQAKGEIIVALDADTVFPTDTIGALAHRFVDPRIGAVAGNAKVGNRINLVTRWQALEYITAQNMDRRAFASLNCITVVPGAVGAWRRDLLERAGGFASDTLAEDQDLTLRVRRLGYKIGYSERAIAWTEAPDTLRALAKQRFRWAFGTLQCMWKHKDALFRPRYGALGFIAMPNVWIFQIIFPLISPVMDLMLIWTFVAAGLDRLQHPNEYDLSNLKQVLFYYALFLLVDWIAAAFAFALERREQWNLLWWLFLQRFCYRQVMYYVMLKSVAIAAKGAIVGWGKLERKATVELEKV